MSEWTTEIVELWLIAQTSQTNTLFELTRSLSERLWVFYKSRGPTEIKNT